MCQALPGAPTQTPIHQTGSRTSESIPTSQATNANVTLGLLLEAINAVHHRRLITIHVTEILGQNQLTMTTFDTTVGQRNCLKLDAALMIMMRRKC